MNYLWTHMEERMDLKSRAKKLKTDIPAVFLAMKKKETPWIAKVIAALTVAYALSPIDFIPDFIPILGYLDDIILLPALVALTIKLIPTEVFSACRVEAASIWQDKKPKNWFFALPIIIFWVLLIFLLVK
ncbi:YkvA family protein [Lachnoclostridium sp.]